MRTRTSSCPLSFMVVGVYKCCITSIYWTVPRPVGSSIVMACEKAPDGNIPECSVCVKCHNLWRWLKDHPSTLQGWLCVKDASALISPPLLLFSPFSLLLLCFSPRDATVPVYLPVAEQRSSSPSVFALNRPSFTQCPLFLHVSADPLCNPPRSGLNTARASWTSSKNRARRDTNALLSEQCTHAFHILALCSRTCLTLLNNNSLISPHPSLAPNLFALRSHRTLGALYNCSIEPRPVSHSLQLCYCTAV